MARRARTAARRRQLCVVAFVALAVAVRADLNDVQDCEPVDCEGGTVLPFHQFESRVEQAFSNCDEVGLEPQQCRVCAESLFAQMGTTADGDKCVTDAQWKIALEMCLAVVKEYADVPADPTEEELELPIPAEPWSGSRWFVSRAQGCSSLFKTGPNTALYPRCSKLVCSVYGNPFNNADVMRNCCSNNKGRMGPHWKHYCWYWPV